MATVGAALEAGNIGVWSWNIDTDALTWSSNLEAIHNLPPGSFDGTAASLERDIHEADRRRVARERDEAVRTGKPYLVRYRLPSRPSEKERWIETTGGAAFSDGVHRRMVGISREVTERVNVDHELRNRVRQQEALAQLGERVLAETNLDRLLNDVVSTVALTVPADFVEVLEPLPGTTDLVLRAGFGWKPGCVGSAVTSRENEDYVRHVLGSSSPIVVADFSAETRFPVPQYLRDHRCASGIITTIAGRDGRAYGVLCVCTKKRRAFDLQHTSFLAAVGNLVAGAIQRRQLEERHELMIRELRHRSGNLFSQLLALFSQTAKNSKSMTELTSKYQARVLALANAHRLITEAGWRSTSLAELLRIVLGPYLDQTSFRGPDVELAPDPTFSLSAALHELAANAIKHGSLSRPHGRLELSWSVARARHGTALTLDWVERNGPPARRPRRSGFGSRLIGLVIERQMGGEVNRSYTKKGLSVHLVVPLSHERWPTKTAAAPASASSTRAT